MFWFIVLLLLLGAGFYFYQKLIVIEQDIRAEQEAEAARARGEAPAAQVSPPPVVMAKAEPAPVPEDRPPTVAETPVADEQASLEDEVLAAVQNLPGILQTDLYASFPDVDKKKLQQLCKDMADGGLLNRQKQGSSFALYPV